MDTLREVEETDREWWWKDSQDKLRKEVNMKNIDKKAKNIVFFLGDGMGVSTLTAARILKGQQDSSLTGGEQTKLVFEEFPYLGLVRTYCYDATVADSACSATGYLGGVRANANTLGVTANVKEGDCGASNVDTNRVVSILGRAQEGGKSTGVVTTDSLTGASPAGTYAHSANRDWENDQGTPPECEDIASQLVHGDVGRGLKVALGGGRIHFRNTWGREDGRKEGIPVIMWRLRKLSTNSTSRRQIPSWVCLPRITLTIILIFPQTPVSPHSQR